MFSPRRELNARLQRRASLGGTAYPFVSFTELSGNQLGRAVSEKPAVPDLPCDAVELTLSC